MTGRSLLPRSWLNLAICVSTLGMVAGHSSANPKPWLRDLLRQPAETREFRVGSFPVTVRIFRLNDPTASRYGLSLVFVTLPSNSYKLTIRDLRQRAEPATLFAEVASKNEELVLVNGGFFGIDNSRPYPIGLIISHGKELNKAWTWHSGGVLLATAESPAQIIPIRNFTQTSAIHEALQSKLLLVEAYHSGIRSDDGQLANRTAIGISRDGSVIVAGAFNGNNEALSLYEFAQVLSAVSEVESKSVDYALYMDGGPSAHIFIPGLNLHFGSDGATYIPNLVRFSLRHE